MALSLFVAVMYLVYSSAASDYETPPMDIAIVIDQTKSVRKDNYVAMLESVKNLISKYNVGPNKDHIAIVTFHRGASIRASLDNSKYYSISGLNELIAYMQHNDELGSPSRTDLALDLVNKEVFTPANGDRPNSPDVLIVFTNGRKHFNASFYSSVVPELMAKGVYRITVGVGKDITHDQDELVTIAGSPDHVIIVESFEDLDSQLDHIKEVTYESVCVLDVAMAIDQTESLGKYHYNSMLDSIKNLISLFNVGKNKTHIAVVSFAGTAKIRASLANRTSQSENALINLLDRMKKEKLSSPTRTDKALEVVFREVFTGAKGDRPNSHNAIIVFTDGGLFHTAKPLSEVIPKGDKTCRVAVGIGKHIERLELETIADSPKRVIIAEKIEDLNTQLKAIRDVIVNACCSKEE